MKSLLKKIIKNYENLGLLGVLFEIIRTVSGFNIFLKRKRRTDHKKILKLGSSKERFEEIYKRNIWGSKESKSGIGSTIDFTKPLRKWLVDNTEKLKIQSIVDAPCGDFNWMQMVTSIADLNYIGLDIVDLLIKSNKKLYASDNISFHVADICKDRIPNCDLLIVRDVLFHFSYNDINKFLKNLYESDYRFLLTTNYLVPENFCNRDISTGAFRVIDLLSFPFNFDKNNISDRIKEGLDANFPRELLLIEKKYVPQSLENTTQERIV